MNENNTVRQSEIVARRTGDSFDNFSADVVNTFVLDPVSLPLLVLAVGLVAARVGYRAARPAATHPKGGVADAASWGIVWGVLGALAGFGLVSEIGLLRSAVGGAELPNWRLAVAGVAVPLLVLVASAAVASVYRILVPSRPPAPGTRDKPAVALALAMGLTVGALAVWWVMAYYTADAAPPRADADPLLGSGGANAVKWYALTGGVLALGSALVGFLYLIDMRSAGWYAALPLALLRVAVYALLCGVFLLPSEQTWERSEKQSRVVLLLDISPSVTDETDELGGGSQRNRIEVLIDALTDDKVNLLKGLLDKNPVAVYAIGSRLDENPVLIPRGGAVWSPDQWRAFSRYDFKPILLRALPDERVRRLVQASARWGTGPGTVAWAETWTAQLRRGDPDLAAFAGLETPADVEAVRKALAAVDKRIDVARTIVQGTNVPESVTAALNREEPNMVQGLVVLSDGRSNLGSEAAYGELRERAARANIPVFTVLVGKDVDRTAITISDVQAPEGAPVDEAWKVIVEATGAGLANKPVTVSLDLYAPGNAPTEARGADKLKADKTFERTLTFSAGQPPGGRVEFVIDPEELHRQTTGLTEMSGGELPKPNFVEGQWAVRARIPRDPSETFPDPEHTSAVKKVTIVKKKLRVLLVTGAPSREFSFVRTLMMREAQNERATLTTLIQNEAGKRNELTAEQKERIITRFPDRFDPAEAGADPAEVPYNFNEYDVLVGFDPDWSELSASQAEALRDWVTYKGGGGGLILVAGPVNTVQLGRIEAKGRLRPVLDVLPVVPADPVSDLQARAQPDPTVARRLILRPRLIAGNDLLKLDDKAGDPAAGWERFFADRDRYQGNPDKPAKDDLTPTRGFYSCFPLVRDEEAEKAAKKLEIAVEPNGVKAGAVAVAEFIDEGQGGAVRRLPYLVLSNPAQDQRTCFLASGELHKLRAYEPADGIGREYFERIWFKLVKYMSGKRVGVARPARGTMLASKVAVTGGPFRVQARVLDDQYKPYDNPTPPTFTIARLTKPGEFRDRKVVHTGPMEQLRNPDGTTSGYYQGEVMLDPAKFPADGAAYAVEVEVPAVPRGAGRPGAPAERLAPSEFAIRSPNPERDNVRPDPAAMVRMAGEFNKDFQGRVPEKVRARLAAELPKEGGVPRLAFRADDPDMLRLIPECMRAEKRNTEVRGPVFDLWDKPLRATVAGVDVRLLDFDMTHKRANDGMLFVAIAGAALLALRAAWAAVSRALGPTVTLAVALSACAVQVGALVGWGVYIGRGGGDWLFQGDWFFLALAVGLLFFQALAFRAEWGVGLAVLAVVAGAGLGLHLWANASSFEPVNVQVSAALLAVVGLLATEWFFRKMVRLA